MPKSVFIHEQQPSLAKLIEQGMRLWHEEVELRPSKNLERLWLMASELMDKELHRKRHAALQRYVKDHEDESPNIDGVIAISAEMMSANSVKHLIVGGALVPNWWDSSEPYPYQGLFVSAFYFMEAKNELDEANIEASWVSLTQAYYYLGMNSSLLTAHESATDAAKSRHANNSKALRKIIVTILVAMRASTPIKSGAKAIKRVVDEISENSDYMAVLNDFDSKSSEKTKISKSLNSVPNTAIDRLRDRLEEWSAPNSPYPDILDAIQPFKQKRKR